jgi:1,4-alpha-glucan branching enzyme
VIKSRGAKGKARVTFTVDPRAGARTAAVCGEWNDWSADADVMRHDTEGGFSLTVDLDAGRAYRFRYLLDGQWWDNDWAADAYVRNDFGGDDSVVDLTALAEAVPPAAKRAKAPAKKDAVKKPSPARTAKNAPAPAKNAPAPAAKPARRAPTK